MNRWQQAKQIRHMLKTKTATDLTVGLDGTTYPTVFGSVACVAQRPREALSQKIGFMLPGVLFWSNGGPSIANRPGRYIQEWAARIIVSNTHDAIGEACLLGGALQGDATLGMGLYQLERYFAQVIKHAGAECGISSELRLLGRVDAVTDPGLGYVVWGEYSFETVAVTEPSYPAATRLAAATPGAGVASLSWRLPTNGERFDLLKVRLAYAAGSTPPTAITEANELDLGSVLPTSFSHTPGAGAQSYSLFSEYDDYSPEPTTAYHTSAAETLTVTVS